MADLTPNWTLLENICHWDLHLQSPTDSGAMNKQLLWHWRHIPPLSAQSCWGCHYFIFSFNGVQIHNSLFCIISVRQDDNWWTSISDWEVHIVLVRGVRRSCLIHCSPVQLTRNVELRLWGLPQICEGQFIAVIKPRLSTLLNTFLSNMMINMSGVAACGVSGVQADYHHRHYIIKR